MIRLWQAYSSNQAVNICSDFRIDRLSRLVDKIYAYVAPKLIGGRDAPGPLGGSGIEHLSDAARLMDLDFTRLGDDILISAYTNVHRDR